MITTKYNGNNNSTKNNSVNNLIERTCYLFDLLLLYFEWKKTRITWLSARGYLLGENTRLSVLH